MEKGFAKLQCTSAYFTTNPQDCPHVVYVMKWYQQLDLFTCYALIWTIDRLNKLHDERPITLSSSSASISEECHKFVLKVVASAVFRYNQNSKIVGSLKC